MKLVLYDYWRSSASYRVRIALNLKGAAHERVAVNLLDGAQDEEAYRAHNPQGLVPMLEADGTRLTQSLAIIAWLDAHFPEPPLLPADGDERAHVISLAMTIAADIHPLNNLRVLNYLRSPLGADEEAIKGWYRHWIATGLVGLEEQARRMSGDGRHMFGSTVTMADICLVPQMYNAVRFKCDLEPFPTLRAINSFLSAQAAFANAVPEVQPDAP